MSFLFLFLVSFFPFIYACPPARVSTLTRACARPLSSPLPTRLCTHETCDADGIWSAITLVISSLWLFFVRLAKHTDTLARDPNREEGEEELQLDSISMEGAGVGMQKQRGGGEGGVTDSETDSEEEEENVV